MAREKCLLGDYFTGKQMLDVALALDHLKDYYAGLSLSPDRMDEKLKHYDKLYNLAIAASMSLLIEEPDEE